MNFIEILLGLSLFIAMFSIIPLILIKIAKLRI